MMCIRNLEYWLVHNIVNIQYTLAVIITSNSPEKISKYNCLYVNVIVNKGWIILSRFVNGKIEYH